MTKDDMLSKIQNARENHKELKRNDNVILEVTKSELDIIYILTKAYYAYHDALNELLKLK